MQLYLCANTFIMKSQQCCYLMDTTKLIMRNLYRVRGQGHKWSYHHQRIWQYSTVSFDRLVNLHHY